MRREAWRNMLVAAINAGLERNLFTLKPGDKWSNRNRGGEMFPGDRWCASVIGCLP